jgi:hypothetical protein
MNSKYILTAVLAALITIGYVSDPVDSPEPEVRHAIKLTTRHLPIHKYFAQEDEDDNLTVSQQYLIARRQTAIKTQTDITPTEDDYVLSDEIKLRLMLARFKALDAYNRAHG